MQLNKFYIAILFFSTLLFGTLHVNGQIPDDIILGLKSGNAKVLSEYFNENVELAVLDNDNVYSKSQAQQIVGNFFKTFTPESFTLIHQGGKEEAKYVIGQLKTNNGVFRVSFLLKQKDGKGYIHQLRIEKQNPQ
jgi:hypothetical protein